MSKLINPSFQQGALLLILAGILVEAGFTACLKAKKCPARPFPGPWRNAAVLGNTITAAQGLAARLARF